MKHGPTSRTRRSRTRSILRLLDLEHSKAAVLASSPFLEMNAMVMEELPTIHPQSESKRNMEY